jgi:hypothetical protein
MNIINYKCQQMVTMTLIYLDLDAIRSEAHENKVNQGEQEKYDVK